MAFVVAPDGGSERFPAGLKKAVREAMPVAVIAALAAACLSFVVTSFLTPHYQSQAMVGVFRQPSGTSVEEGDGRPLLPAEPAVILNHASFLRSTDFATSVATKAGLAEKSAFNPTAGLTPLNDILVGVGVAENPLAGASQEEMVSSILGKLTIAPDTASGTIRILFASEDAMTAAVVANTIAQSYGEAVSHEQIPGLSEDVGASGDTPVNPAIARIINEAVPSDHASFPNKSAIMAFTAFVVLLLALVGVVLYKRWSGKLPLSLEPLLRRQDGASSRFADAIQGALSSQAATGTAPAIRQEAASHPVAPPPSPTAYSVPEEKQMPDIAEFTVEAVADLLETDGVPLAVCVSPEGDEGSAAAVMLTRNSAGEGRRAILIDLTASGCPTALMGETNRLPGLTNLLCGEIDIADAIHPDRMSDAHIMPRGLANVRRAMRAIDDLPGIINTLCEAYDLVVVECGAADAEGVARIVRSQDAEIILSIVRPDEAEIAELVEDFFEEGLDRPLLMTTASPNRKQKAKPAKAAPSPVAQPEPLARLEALIERKTLIKPIAPAPEIEAARPEGDRVANQSVFQPDPPVQPLFKAGSERTPLRRSPQPQSPSR